MEQKDAKTQLKRFTQSGVPHATLSLVYGRRRIGKSTLLAELARDNQGFYWEATRGEASIHLARLGTALGDHLGVGPLRLPDWESALDQLLALDGAEPLLVVLDEFGYLLEGESALDSLIANALGPGSRVNRTGHVRLILCGSAIAMMRSLTHGQAPLRGRAGIAVVMQPHGFRSAARLLGRGTDQSLALRVFSVIGGVIGYYTDMVDHDLPSSLEDFDGWVSRRVLSPAATLHHEATTLLAEDPTLSAANQSVHHSILGVIANGAVTAGRIANRLRRSVSNLDPALKRLIDTGFVLRHEDPIRGRRPTYSLADPFLQFHYAVLEPYATALRHREPLALWQDRLAQVFDARVRGPVFEEVARTWIRAYAGAETIGGQAAFVGPSSAVVDGVEFQLDVVVAAGEPGVPPGERTVVAIGEAKAGARIDIEVVRHLEAVRAALGTRAAQAKLLLFASEFAEEIRQLGDRRPDLELVDLERLYGGS